jgi:outer membrane protein TolC
VRTTKCERKSIGKLESGVAMTRHFILLVLTAAFATAADRPTLPANLTLADALTMALANGTAIREAQSGLDQVTGRYSQSRSSRLPQVDIAMRQNLQTVNLIGVGIPIASELGKIGPFGSMDARIFLSQELLNLAHRRSWESVKAQEDSSKFLVNNARELVTLNVVSAYLAALKAKATRDTLVEQIGLANELYKLTRERVDQGIAAELDAVRAMQQVNTLEQQRQEAEQNYVAAKLQLANLIQARASSDFDVTDTAAYGSGTLPDRDAAMQAALASRFDYRSAEANLNAAGLKVRSIKSTRLPTLTAQFDDGQSGSTPVHNMNTYKVQGVIDIPVFTGGRTRGEIDEAEGLVHEAQVALDASRSQIETEVLAAISGVEWSLKEVATSAGNVTLSRQELQLSRSRFSQGITDNTEVVNAQDRLSKADDASIRAQYLLGLSRANLARAVGTAETTYHK